MSRIASLVGITDSGDLVSVGIGNTPETITKLVEQRQNIREAAGLFRRGSRELRLTELHLIATATAGGELKGRLKFTPQL